MLFFTSPTFSGSILLAPVSGVDAPMNTGWHCWAWPQRRFLCVRLTMLVTVLCRCHQSCSKFMTICGSRSKLYLSNMTLHLTASLQLVCDLLTYCWLLADKNMPLLCWVNKCSRTRSTVQQFLSHLRHGHCTHDNHVEVWCGQDGRPTTFVGFRALKRHLLKKHSHLQSPPQVLHETVFVAKQPVSVWQWWCRRRWQWS